MPQRHQRQRKAGWTTPVDAEGRPAKYVGRGTKYGNPWRVIRDGAAWTVVWTGHHLLPDEYAHPHNGAYRVTCAYQQTAHTESVRFYRDWLQQARPDLVGAARSELAGRDLMCWCATDLPCHADALIELCEKEPARA